MGKSILTVKVDEATKRGARQLAKTTGLTLSQLVDRQLAQAIVAGPGQLDSPGEIRPAVADYLKQASTDAAAGRNTRGPFKTADETIRALYRDD